MIAIIKATGEYVEVSRIQAVAGNNLYQDANSGITYHPEELESIEIIRIKSAIAAMQGMLANPAHQKVQVESGEPFGYFYAMNAIMCADVLVEELQKKGGEQ